MNITDHTSTWQLRKKLQNAHQKSYFFLCNKINNWYLRCQVFIDSENHETNVIFNFSPNRIEGFIITIKILFCQLRKRMQKAHIKYLFFISLQKRWCATAQMTLCFVVKYHSTIMLMHFFILIPHVLLFFNFYLPVNLMISMTRVVREKFCV